MRDALRTLWLMLAISLRADRARSLAALASASLQLIVLPLRVVGLELIADGVTAHSSTQAWTGVAIVVGLTLLNRVASAVSLTVRMRLRENTQLYLDTYLMDLTAGIPGIAHHELPEYLDRVELIRTERNYLANPFNPISWTLASILQAVPEFQPSSTALAAAGGTAALLQARLLSKTA